MSLVGAIHGKYVLRRRAQALAARIAPLLPPDSRVLDVGAGDGLIARLVTVLRPDVNVSGVDTLIRPKTHVPVLPYTGSSLPYADHSMDAILLIDVLHHARTPAALLREARRVARRAVILKDHLCEGNWQRRVLRAMDYVGNAHEGVELTDGYLSRSEWDEMFQEVGLRVDTWQERLELYPAPFSWVFEHGLHFMARLVPQGTST